MTGSSRLPTPAVPTRARFGPAALAFALGAVFACVPRTCAAPAPPGASPAAASGRAAGLASPTPGVHSPYRITARAGGAHVSLDGTWQLCSRGAPIGAPSDLDAQAGWVNASVPCTVQWALHRAGVLPHPYEHLNSRQYDWVDQKVWYSRRAIALPEIPEGHLAFLCFDGIDYFARVWFNGTLLGSHQGMFGGPSVEVSRLVRAGCANDIVVEVKAANFGCKESFKPRGPEGTVIKPWVIAGGVGAEMFFPVGMWRGARIEIVPETHIERPFLVTESVSGDEARLVLHAEIFAGGHSLEQRLHPWGQTHIFEPVRWDPAAPVPSALVLRVRMAAESGAGPVFERTFALETQAGRNFVRLPFVVSAPALWWPNGMGDQNLYRVTLTLLRDGAPRDAVAFDAGIRTVAAVPSAGVRTTDRWAAWQFVVNGRRLFVKGMNWMPADILLDLPRARYEWLLGLARSAGIQMLRVWGGGILETEEFYETCNRLGLMVWQDFPIGNRDTPEWPQDVWEAQVMQTIFRVRNHPSLVLYCGGNEFNPYSTGNTASIGILERCVADFDPTRAFRRTSPDAGSIHTYPDMDPTWYARLHARVPWVAETGMHNVPDIDTLLEFVDPAEVNGSLGGMLDKDFPVRHPELMHHFVEYQASRVPRMLSRASHIDDMSAPTLAALAEATQVGAGEFYQILSEQLQANYPVTTGLMPWVFKRPWPVIAIMLVDGIGQPTAPYYFLKRTYEPDHVSVHIPRLLWAKGERVPLDVRVLHAGPEPAPGVDVTLRVLDPSLGAVHRRSATLSLEPGPSVARVPLGEFRIPDTFESRFFFLVADLRDGGGRFLSRSVYWPRCLEALSDADTLARHRAAPVAFPTLTKGPWLKPQAAGFPTRIELSCVRCEMRAPDRTCARARVRNAGGHPAIVVRLDVSGARRTFVAGDNFLWLDPGEEREIDLDILWRAPRPRVGVILTASAWNAPEVRCPLAADAP